MDFWAQHKDFILKVLAGVGVFLVALIARGITYGDELENAQRKNQQLAGTIKRLQIAPLSDIEGTERDAEALARSAGEIARQVGYDLGSDDLAMDLLKRTLGYTRRFAAADDAAQAAAAAREAIQQDVNGGFGQLRLMVRQEFAEEAGEKNILLAEGIGYENVTEVEDGELLKYLMQLELVARAIRYAIDANVDAITEVQITTKQRGEPIPGANPDFLQEYPVTITFRGSERATHAILNRLEDGAPRPPLRELELTRLPRPPDHVEMELTVMATAADAGPQVPFLAPEKKE